MEERKLFLDKKSRRAWLREIACAGVVLPVLGLRDLAGIGAQTKPKRSAAPSSPVKSPFSQNDDAILEQIEAASFKYFWAQAHPDTGMVMDRCDARNPAASDLGSIAATGFGLTALCIGEKRGYVARGTAENRVLNTMRFLWKKLPNHRGFFYHFANINSGERLWDSEVSSIDTAILLCGVLNLQAAFSEFGDR